MKLPGAWHTRIENTSYRFTSLVDLALLMPDVAVFDAIGGVFVCFSKSFDPSRSKYNPAPQSAAGVIPDEIPTPLRILTTKSAARITTVIRLLTPPIPISGRPRFGLRLWLYHLPSLPSFSLAAFLVVIGKSLRNPFSLRHGRAPLVRTTVAAQNPQHADRYYPALHISVGGVNRWIIRHRNPVRCSPSPQRSGSTICT
ncbi:unnamed protein product [Tuber aestivum]|uniref:Uncharacterized protein n=1 Tax=Tuber aestivum TaxID=59557 RepID=A0A292Q7B4_9PEZI|nr:unnamed protein product [Tuber aestivum]